MIVGDAAEKADRGREAEVVASRAVRLASLRQEPPPPTTTTTTTTTNRGCGGAAGAAKRENSGFTVTRRERADAVSRSACWVGPGARATLQRIFGWVRMREAELGLDHAERPHRGSVVTAEAELEAGREELLAFYRQLVISTSATRIVDTFSVEIFEAAAERALLLGELRLLG
jgi:hypothetical protein